MPINVKALDRLKAQLLTSGLQERNNALFQVINQLIDNLRQNINETQSQISTISTTSSGGGGGGTVINNLITGSSGPIALDLQDDDWSIPFVGNVINGGNYTQKIP